MGRQVTVGLAPLLKAGCALKVVDCKGMPSWLSVTLPDSRVINSNTDDCLNFDCRTISSSTYGWMETWLQETGVPYAAG